MKWPWHLLARVKGLSYKRLRRTRIETLESDLKQAVALPEGATGEEREEREKEKETVTRGLSDREPHWAEVLRCKDSSVLWRLIREADLIGAMWCERGRLSISCSHSTACISVLSISAFCHSSPSMPPLLSWCSLFSLSVVEEGHTSFIQILPFVCALLTFDILLDLLAEWPKGFSFCKGRKERQFQWVKN